MEIHRVEHDPETAPHFQAARELLRLSRETMDPPSGATDQQIDGQKIAIAIDTILLAAKISGVPLEAQINGLCSVMAVFASRSNDPARVLELTIWNARARLAAIADSSAPTKGSA